MKKIIKTLLVVMVVVLALVAFTACENDPATTTTEACQHEGGTATCTEQAVCTKCGVSYGPVGHKTVILPALAPTCAKEGRTEGSYCKVCNEVFAEQQTIAKLEHVWVANEDRDFTCTLDGFVGGNHCETCGIQDGTIEIIPAHCVWGEEYVYSEPTCGATGILAHDCTVCGAKEKVADIPATGEHSFTIDVPALDPTCAEDGHTACKLCEVCGTPNEDYEVIPATKDHQFNEDELFYYPEPTCTESGYLAGYCVTCGGGFYLAELPANGHSWDGDCDTAGTCTVCGAVQEAPVGHILGEDGVCTVCGNIPVYTAEELIEMLGAGKNVILMNDIVMDTTLKCPYGNNVGVAQKGGSLDGNGYTLTVNGSGNYYAIITYGGTIANITINSGFRAIVLYTPTEDVILDNVTIAGDNIVYGFNTAEYPTLEGIDIVVKNSTLSGWVSFAGDYASVSFENCKFIQGVAYTDAIGRLIRPYLSTTFTNCEFVKNAYLDLSALEAGETVTLVGCKVAGVDVTVDVFTTVEDHEEIPFTYEAPSGVELVLTAVEGGVSFHRHGYVSTVTAPTCTEAGYTTTACPCGDSNVSDEVEATGHAYVDGICANCGEPKVVLSNAVLDFTTKDNRVSFSTEEQVWSQNGITFTLNRGEGSAYSDKAPVEFGSKGSLKIEGAGIKVIVIETGNTTYGTYVSNCFNGQPGVASVSAKSGVVTIVLSEEVDVFVIEYLAKQGKIKTLTINPVA